MNYDRKFPPNAVAIKGPAATVVAIASGAQTVTEIMKITGLSRGVAHQSARRAVMLGLARDLSDEADHQYANRRPSGVYRPAVRIVQADPSILCSETLHSGQEER